MDAAPFAKKRTEKKAEETKTRAFLESAILFLTIANQIPQEKPQARNEDSSLYPLWLLRRKHVALACPGK